MAEVKISALTSATTPLAGTEVVPIVQGGVTKKVAVSNLGGLSYPSFETLSYATDANVDNITPQYGVLTATQLNPVFTHLQSLGTNTFKYYAKFWDKVAIFQSQSTSQISGGMTYFTINNENLTFFNWNYNGSATTFNLNATHIGQIQQFAANHTYNLPNCTHYWNTSFPQFSAANVTFNAPNLVFLNATLSFNNVVTYNLNSLEFVSALSFANNTNAITTFNSNTLKYISSSLSVASNDFTSLTLNALEIVGGSISLAPFSGANLFTTFSFNNIKEVVGNFTTSSGIGLNQTSVDHILVKLAALDGTNGTATYSNKTVTVYGATPSATGLAAKATLVARGCTVTTN